VCVLDGASVGISSKLLGDDLGCNPEVTLHGLSLSQVVVCFDECVVIFADDDVDVLDVWILGGVHTQIISCFLAACEALSWQRSS
jgi:hypothetical protein